MNIIFIVSRPSDWPFEIPNAKVVDARTYLTDPAYDEQARIKICNLCSADRYQSLGYYVSLLGEARGHAPLPRISAIENLQSQNLVRLLTEGLDELVQRSLVDVDGTELQLNIYFGRDLAQQYEALSRQLFNVLQAPLLRAHFKRYADQWNLYGVQALSATEIPVDHHSFIKWAATDYFVGYERRTRKRSTPDYELAILYDPDDPEPPSNMAALQKFSDTAEALGIHTELITRSDYGRLSEFDALFIRDTTSVNDYTFRFSQRAAALGLVVIDDPVSILRCSNKVYLAELLARHRVSTPKTLLVHKDNIDQIIPTLGLPCIIKQPDSAFSLGVVKIESEQNLFAKASELLDQSELIVAQEFLPTQFDWRVGVLNRKPLYVCKYYMAPGHWQIIKREEDKQKQHEGRTAAIPFEEVPKQVVDAALKAANLIGNGLYGVDLKQVGDTCYVIEVNDNPNVDAGNEDGVVGEAIYREIMELFLKRIEERNQQRLRNGTR